VRTPAWEEGRGARGWLYTLVGTVTGLILLALAYWFVVRPWHLKWGATDDEVRRPLPGDDLVTNPKGRTTRAITTRASTAGPQRRFPR
jgi:hypothetical protein